MAERMRDGGTEGVVIFALHEAVEPPFEPIHDQDHGHIPVTEDGVPVLQRFVVGVVGTVVPFADPHAPFIGDGGGVDGLELDHHPPHHEGNHG